MCYYCVHEKPICSVFLSIGIAYCFRPACSVNCLLHGIAISGFKEVGTQFQISSEFTI